MALNSSIAQLTVGTTAVQLTTSTKQLIYGIRVAVITSGVNICWGPAGVTTSTGFPILNGNLETQINPADFTNVADVYFVSDTANSVVGINIVGQPYITIGS